MALELVTQRKPGEGETAGSGTAGRRPEEQRPATADGDRKGDRRTGGGSGRAVSQRFAGVDL